MKSIRGFEGRYSVTQDGRIYSHKNKKFLNTCGNNYGYHFVSLTAGSIRKQYRVHRIVAQAFIPNPEKLPEVNHIDGDKGNNAVSNLEWCSRSTNVLHSYRTGLKKAVNQYTKTH